MSVGHRIHTSTVECASFEEAGLCGRLETCEEDERTKNTLNCFRRMCERRHRVTSMAESEIAGWFGAN